MSKGLLGGREKGKSATAKYRHWLMENDPEKYEIVKATQRERAQERKEKRTSQWATGTRAAEEEKEAYYSKKREINRRYRQKIMSTNSRQTRTSVASVSNTPRVDRKAMTPEERREHDNSKRRAAYADRSKQKKIADKKKNAARMREYRLRRKEETLMAKRGQVTPNATSTPKSTPMAPPAAPIINEVPVATPAAPVTPVTADIAPPATPPKRDRLRQHCYNVTSQVKSALNNFTEEEAATMTYNLVMRKTPEKRKKNLQKLRENPAVQKALSTPDSPKKFAATVRYIKSAKRMRKSRHYLVKHEIKRFFLRPDVARALPHCRFATKHGPGYVMQMTLKNALKLFEEESGRKVSFSLFASLRPRNVRKIGTVATETCLCICCTNVKLKIDAINRKLPSPSIPPEGKLLDFVLCPYKGRWPRMNCVEGKCIVCKDFLRPFTLAAREIFHENISWMHWERRPRVNADGQSTLKLDVFEYNGSVYDLLTQFSKDLEEPIKNVSFMKHLFVAYWQQSQYNLSKDTLQRGQLLMVQDFAKNRTASYTQEVKSAFFGKQQITMHPTVCYIKNDEGQIVRHVILSFSDDIKHDAHHVHAVTQNAINIVKASHNIKEVIIWSDGAASQYKGRRTFADLSLYPLPTERNYFGSEHGKGEADGETGRFAQAMRRACASGTNFRYAQDMVDFASSCYTQDPLKKYTFVNLPVEDIRRDRPETDVSTIPGSRGFHQVVKKKPYILGVRNLSCFCSGCRAGEETCCINKAHVDVFDIVKVKTSVPQDEAFLEDEPEDQPPPPPAVYTTTDCPAVGQWIDIVGEVSKKKGIVEERSFKAVVIDTPSGGYEDYFYVQFLKKTSAGSYVLAPGDVSHIHPETEAKYKWKVIPAPLINNRNHHFFC